MDFTTLHSERRLWGVSCVDGENESTCTLSNVFKIALYIVFERTLNEIFTKQLHVLFSPN
jgi:hypothetical protein